MPIFAPTKINNLNIYDYEEDLYFPDDGHRCHTFHQLRQQILQFAASVMVVAVVVMVVVVAGQFVLEHQPAAATVVVMMWHHAVQQNDAPRHHHHHFRSDMPMTKNLHFRLQRY